MMNMQMNMNQNVGITNQMSYYNQQQAMPRQLPNVDNILFVADLPDEACEEDLANFFKSYNFSFAKVLHNAMRTHAFVTFTTAEDANRARTELNGVKMAAKYANNKVTKPVRLCKYETKQGASEYDERTNLLVKNVAKEVSAHSFFNMFRQFGDVRSCKLVVDYLGNSKGYGYVSFYKLEDSERARAEWNDKEVNGKALRVDFLEHGRRVEKRRNNIYIKHIPKEQFSDEDLKNLFEPYGEIKSAIVLKDNEGKSKGFGFVCYEKSEDAEEAFRNMQNKTIWKDLPAIYVNFAMKKSERLEHLQKKREETFKSAQKMTVFAKIKDENLISSEIEFTNAIKSYLNTIFGKEYDPKSIKVRFETKNAFITMDSQRDSEEFIRKFQEFAKENVSTLFFNLYKSKVERITANAYFKKYNNLTGEGEMNTFGKPQGRYRKYNEGVNQNQNQEMPFVNANGTMRYNNFDDVGSGQNPNAPNSFNQNRYVSYNNFPNMPQGMQQGMQQGIQKDNKFNQFAPQVPKFDPMDEDSIGEYLYAFVEKIYPDHASKITGMLMETDPSTRFKLINSRPEELSKVIHTAYNQLLQNN